MTENERHDLEGEFQNHQLPASISWDYVSGFFDGEGSITVEAPAGSGVLVISLTFSQKYRPLLEAVAAFLNTNGIYGTIYPTKETVNEIRARRIGDICRLLSKMNLFLKREQALAVLSYYNGAITGNKLLRIFDSEYRLGKRRSTPMKPGLDFRLRHTQAVINANNARAAAARKVNLKLTREAPMEAVKLLPDPFVSADVARAFGCSQVGGLYRIHRMEENGLVSCRKVGTRGQGKMVCTKLGGELSTESMD